MSLPPPSSCTQSRAGPAPPARRLRGSQRLAHVVHTQNKSASTPFSSASPTASDAYHVRQSPCDRPCIQAIPALSSNRVLSPSQVNQRIFPEKAGLSGSLSDSCAAPNFVAHLVFLLGVS